MKLLTLCALSLLATTAANASTETQSLLWMQCTASHPDTEQTFFGEGLKFVGAHMAIQSCEEWAGAEQKDQSKCKIETCEPVFDAPF